MDSIALNLDSIKFNADGLIPAILQDATTKQVLMMAWMNAEALEASLATKRAVFWSRSRQTLWVKGDTSGNFQDIVSAHLDCDQDTLLFMVNPKGPACHTGAISCFLQQIDC